MLKRTWLSLVLACLFCVPVAVKPPSVQAGMFSREQEIRMGQETGKRLEAQYGLSQDYRLQEKVERVGKRLAAVCKRQDIEYTFKVLNNEEINALACPGGYIYVFKGLLDFMPSDTELAGVLSHEITHVAEKHTLHAIEKQMLGSVLLLGAAIASGGEAMQALSVTQDALFSGFSRTDERGADKGGLYNCIAAGYNPYSVLITMQKLDEYNKEKGYSNNYGVFSTHPEPEERTQRLQKLLDKLDIHPLIKFQDDDHAVVQEGAWSFSIDHSIGATKAKYRAYMLAGSLWTIRQKGPLEPTHFVVYDNGTTADIYYDDTQLYTIYPQDAPDKMTPGLYAAQCAEEFKRWAVQTNNKGKNKKENLRS